MSSLLTRAVVVAVHGHKQLTTAPVGIHLRARQSQHDHIFMTALPIILMIANLFLFIPALLYAFYTLGSVLPTLVSVEAPQEAYAPIPVHDEQESEAKDDNVPSKAPVPEAEEAGAITPPPVTSSIRATHKHLCAVSSAGWRALFRGLGLALTTHFASAFIASLFVMLPLTPTIVPVFLAEVLLVQLNTAWVHCVISTSPQPWWRRIPPFSQTLKATILPLCALALSVAAASGLPTMLLLAMGRPMVDFEMLPAIHIYIALKNGGDAVLYIGLWLGVMIFAACPASVVLTRVQASLLPDTDETIVPIDRSLGRTTPQPSAGQRMKDAYTSFSGSWGRYYRMMAKAFAAFIAVGAALCAVAGVEFGVAGLVSK